MEMCGWSSKLVSDTGLVYQCQQGPQVQSSWVFGKGEAKKHLSGPLGPFCSFFPGETVWAPCRNRESPTVPSVHTRRRFFTGPSVGAFLPLYLSGDLIKGTEMGPGQFTAFWGLTWSPFQGKDLYPAKASNQLRANRLGKIRQCSQYALRGGTGLQTRERQARNGKLRGRVARLEPKLLCFVFCNLHPHPLSSCWMPSALPPAS